MLRPAVSSKTVGERLDKSSRAAGDGGLERRPGQLGLDLCDRHVKPGAALVVERLAAAQPLLNTCLPSTKRPARLLLVSDIVPATVPPPPSGFARFENESREPRARAHPHGPGAGFGRQHQAAADELIKLSRRTLQAKVYELRLKISDRSFCVDPHRSSCGRADLAPRG